MSTPVNDMWSTINKGIDAISQYRNAKLSARPAAPVIVQTTAAPSGAPSSTGVNPFPGTQGAFPQAEAAPKPGAGLSSSMPQWALIALGVLGLIVLASFVRR